jgi:hypothetical protein
LNNYLRDEEHQNENDQNNIILTHLRVEERQNENDVVWVPPRWVDIHVNVSPMKEDIDGTWRRGILNRKWRPESESHGAYTFGLSGSGDEEE